MTGSTGTFGLGWENFQLDAFRTSVRTEETAKSISAARLTAAGVTEVMLLLGNGVLLLLEWGFEVVVEIPIGESGGRSPIEKDGK